MTRIGLISDTHGYLDERLYDYFKKCDEIWHAGDIGALDISEKLVQFRPFKAVCGNIDGPGIRAMYPENNRFFCEEMDVWIKHIGGYPGNYDRTVRKEIISNPPGLFISGHSHILKVLYDRKLNLLHINPGAAGKAGLHKKRTAVRFTIDKKEIKDLEVIELGENS
ncbi:MAG: metallophosphoesterase family protein [Bacteroidales bacterium]|nr:MAG: metallophosphoesterase family protein [Bacteroidales bacterium]